MSAGRSVLTSALADNADAFIVFELHNHLGSCRFFALLSVRDRGGFEKIYTAARGNIRCPARPALKATNCHRRPSVPEMCRTKDRHRRGRNCCEIVQRRRLGNLL